MILTSLPLFTVYFQQFSLRLKTRGLNLYDTHDILGLKKIHFYVLKNIFSDVETTIEMRVDDN
jgi:hypothetical protein